MTSWSFSGRWPRLAQRAFQPVDPASLNILRVVFGLTVGFRALKELALDVPATRWTYPVLFHYPGFEWVGPLGPEAMTAATWLLAAAAAAVVFGWRTRWAAGVQALILTWFFLLDATTYNNHGYLIVLLAWLLVVAPTHLSGSLDARRRGPLPTPLWALWIFQFQIGVPYLFGGLAKINPDWLMRGEPLHSWMSQGRMEGTVDLPWFGEHWFALAMSWSGFLLDLLIVPALLWPRTRKLAFAAVTAFHLLNAQMFEIGVFPWMMIGATTIFFAPDWPRRFGWRPLSSKRSEIPRRPFVLWALGFWVLIQVVLPFRHLLYPGPVDWTEEGHRFAWRMKIRDKVGQVHFLAVERGGRETLYRDYEGVLTNMQFRMMLHDPDMIRQFAVRLADQLEERNGTRPEVRALTRISLNGRPPQPMLDPEVDLAALRSSWRHKEWILPLESTARREHGSPGL